MTVRERMAKIVEGTPTYGTKPKQSGNVSGGPEKDQGKSAKDGGGRKSGETVSTPHNKGPEKADPEPGKGKKGAGKAIGIKGRMEALTGQPAVVENKSLDRRYLDRAGENIAEVIKEILAADDAGDFARMARWVKNLGTELKMLTSQHAILMDMA